MRGARRETAGRTAVRSSTRAPPVVGTTRHRRARCLHTAESTARLGLTMGDPAPAPPLVWKLHRRAAMGTRRVLIVDDDAAMAEAVADALEVAGWTLAVAGGVQEALRLLSSSSYRVVVSDIRMRAGEADGFDLLRAIRKTHPSTQVILMSAFPSPETPARAREEGAAAFFSKPFKLSELGSALELVAKQVRAVSS